MATCGLLIAACSNLPPAHWPPARAYELLVHYQLEPGEPGESVPIPLSSTDPSSDVEVIDAVIEGEHETLQLPEEFRAGGLERHLRLDETANPIVVRLRLRVRDADGEPLDRSTRWRRVESLFPRARRVDVLSDEVWIPPIERDGGSR